MERFLRVWVFSDLHLSSPQEPLYRSLLRVLEEPQNGDDAVVFAGDIFDLLVGDSDHYRIKHRDFLESLERLLRKGVRVFYIEGNHDFHLAGLLPRGVRFESEAVCLEVGVSDRVRRLYVAHGDLVDLTDRGYLRLRRFFRSSPLRWLAHSLPGKGIDLIATQWSRSPDRKVQDLPEHWSASDRDVLRSRYREFAARVRARGFDGVILGHCHDLDSEGGYYFNMGYPPVHRQYLICPDPENSGEEMIVRRNFPGF